jgi:hypothetical protein
LSDGRRRRLIRHSRWNITPVGTFPRSRKKVLVVFTFTGSVPITPDMEDHPGSL